MSTVRKNNDESFEALFEGARSDAFTPAESEQLWQNVLAAGSGAGDVGPRISGEGPAGVAKWIGPSGAVKLGAMLLVAGGAAAAFGMSKRSPRADEARPPPTAEVARAVDPPPARSGGPPVVSFEDLPRVPDVPVAPARPLRARTEPATTLQASNPLPVSTASAVPAASVVRAAPAPGSEVAPSATTDEPPEAPVSRINAGPGEGALLLRARQELASDPASALELTDEDARRFPDGPLAPEREVLAVEALVRLQRGPGARARLAAFRSRYPDSPHLAHLDALVGP